MDPTAAFAAIVDAAEVHLDEAAVAMAAHVYPQLEIDAQVERLDELAHRVREPTRRELCRVLFMEAGLRGNGQDFYDPDNSFLNRVLDRGLGIPISLAVVMIEVGRRCGVPLTGINAPSHFLVRDDTDGSLLDPFNGGQEVPFVEAPTADAVIILDRMLGNLRTIYTTRGDLTNLLWVLRLRTLVPGATADREHELTRVVARLN